jgi:hypothetical protein
MLQGWIRIDGQEHFIPPQHDIEAIMKTITELVRAGGGFVEIVRTPDRVLNVLVSPGTSVSIEVTEVEDPEPRPGIEREQTPLAQTNLDFFDV